MSELAKQIVETARQACSVGTIPRHFREALEVEIAHHLSTPQPDPQSDVDKFWAMLDRCFEIEPREYFEKEARTNGFDSPLAMACFYMWKREAKRDPGILPNVPDAPQPTGEQIECPACSADVVVGGNKMECAARCGWRIERATVPDATVVKGDSLQGYGDPTRFTVRGFTVVENKNQNLRLIDRDDPKQAITIAWDDLSALREIITLAREDGPMTIGREGEGDAQPPTPPTVCGKPFDARQQAAYEDGYRVGQRARALSVTDEKDAEVEAPQLGLFAVFYDNESRPVAGFVLEQDAERHAKQYSGGAPYRIEHVHVVRTAAVPAVEAVPHEYEFISPFNLSNCGKCHHEFKATVHHGASCCVPVSMLRAARDKQRVTSDETPD